MQSGTLILIIAMLAAAGIVIRPFRVHEAVWAGAGALALVGFGLLPLADAAKGVREGLDVYMFLAGMMLLSELAREQGLFDWVAAVALVHARGSPRRLFGLVYLAGVLVTVFLSNDATAVVLTPAVYAATRTAKVSDPLPYLYTCAFIANAASFVLPISNPANLVVFGAGHLPPLAQWLALFGIASVLAIGATYLVLRFVEAGSLARETIANQALQPELSSGGRLAGLSIGFAALVLIAASAFGFDLGLPTLLSAVVGLAIIAVATRINPLLPIRRISWGVIVLVAALFVLVEGIGHTGIEEQLVRTFAGGAHSLFASAGLVAVASNLANNLPIGLFAGHVVRAAHATRTMSAAIVIGVDLGPNLSVTGSLATILWLAALRRENLHVGAWQFLKLGCLVMPPALLLSLAALAL